ncbi:MAG: hypothetical protein PHQ42_03350 [Patescibacteria group bacterium]|nr:hypothetical protein [Patescibacteria group bacterium]
MERREFLARKKVGLILRVYAHEEDRIPTRVEMIEKAIAAARKATVDGRALIKRIDVLVWCDKNYADSDCGQTAAILREKFSGEKDLFISEVSHGDIFCGILNYGIVHQLRHGVDYSIIASAEAFSYMTPETMAAMVNAACSGALAIGVAINELTDSILAGRIANTFAMWHNESLMTVGGFDLRAAKPVNETLAHFMRGWNPKKNENVFYHLAGVEEVIPLARMAETFGPCIAPIFTQGEGVQQYQAPDPAKDPELWQRHVAKMGTKLERQCALLASIGVDPSFLKGGVMPEYR